MEVTFRLRRQAGGVTRFAEVTVRVSPVAEHDVVLGEDTFGWRRDAYGPGASTGSPYDEGLRAEAREGARLGLRQLPDDAPTVRVLVAEIVETAADTGPGDVRFAAAHAVWRALGFTPDEGEAAVTPAG